MHPNEAEVSTGLDADGEPEDIMIRFGDDECVFFDTREEAVEWADETEEALREEGLDETHNPSAFNLLEDVRERADEVFD